MSFELTSIQTIIDSFENKLNSLKKQVEYLFRSRKLIIQRKVRLPKYIKKYKRNKGKNRRERRKRRKRKPNNKEIINKPVQLHKIKSQGPRINQDDQSMSLMVQEANSFINSMKS